MYNETKDYKKLKDIYYASSSVKNAIPHPRILGVIKECGGKMWMRESERLFEQMEVIRLISMAQNNGNVPQKTSSSHSTTTTRQVHHSVYRSSSTSCSPICSWAATSTPSTHKKRSRTRISQKLRLLLTSLERTSEERYMRRRRFCVVCSLPSTIDLSGSPQGCDRF
jgi:hypothetical protein